MPLRSLRRRSLTGFALLGIAAGPLAAWPLDAFAADAGPTVPIQHLYDGLLNVMKAGHSAPFSSRFALLAPTVDAVVDMETILEASIGRTWSELSPDDRGALRDAFRRYTIDSYVSSFNAFSGQQFQITPETRALPDGEQVVTTRIIPTSGDSHRLDYVMRQETGAWKVVDVLADGTISHVAVQRSDFRHLLMQGGGESLVASLQRKASDLETG